MHWGRNHAKGTIINSTLRTEVSQYLNDLGYKLVSNSADPPGSLSFLVKDDAINAFALPGRYIGIHSGLILSSGSESELAGA